MHLSDFDFHLPKQNIAQKPAEPRDSSRLLVLDKESGKTDHRIFSEIVEYFEPGDVLVMNNTKVFPARLIGKKDPSGGKIEVFLHQKIRDGKWNCLVGGKGRKKGLGVSFEKDGQTVLRAEIARDNLDGTWEVVFDKKDGDFISMVERIGQTPLPPYIKRELPGEKDKDTYQTVYADPAKTGSVAAPTAGLHFTNELLESIRSKGVQTVYITLQVGLGTFAPVKTNDISKHKMHGEWVEISREARSLIGQAKQNGSRIFAVGTTSVRSLEAMAREEGGGDFRKMVDIFIYPGFEFKIVDAMITNFHLPKSTLLMLVSAFAGRENVLSAYREAVVRDYRFYSYGDAMLIK